MLGINTGLRISDILPIKAGMTRGEYIDLIEQKTGKAQHIIINDSLRKALDPYIKNLLDNDYLFPSRNKKKKSGLKQQPIDSSMAYKMISKVAHKHGVYEIGTHSLRKTFGYHYYARTKNIALLMDLYNHSEESITKRYLGIKQDTLDEARLGSNL
jgi:integrase